MQIILKLCWQKNRGLLINTFSQLSTRTEQSNKKKGLMRPKNKQTNKKYLTMEEKCFERVIVQNTSV